MSGATGLSLATASRILRALIKHGFVEMDAATRRYTLGVRLVQLGLTVWHRSELRDVARPVMEDLAHSTGETAYLVVRDGLHGVFVEKVESPLKIRIIEPLGVPMPLCTGASKKALLAFQRPETLSNLLARLAVAYPDLDTARLQAELAAIRSSGYAFTVGEATPGTAGVAAPIFNANGEAVAAISLAGPQDRFTPERLPILAEAIRGAGAMISARLGHAGAMPYIQGGNVQAHGPVS